MSKFYIVSGSYYPNTATTNRLMGFLKAFSKMGIKVDMVFFMPDPNYSKAPEMDNITFHYYWKYLPISSKFRFILYQFLYNRIFISKVKAGDTVLLYCCDDILTMLSKKEDVNIFYERTEHTNFARTKFLDYNKFFSACSKIKGLFLISTGLAKHFKEKGINEEKIHIINMTVDQTRFNGLVKQPTEEKYIAYCGTASNNKDGVDELIKSFAIVHKKKPSLKLMIIGKTPSKDDASGNIELIRKLNLEDFIIFTGVVSAENIPQILKNAEVLVLDRPNSIQAECGFPTKLGEYLLSENPVVITNVGDITKFLSDGVSARIAEEKNPSDFAEKILWCLNNPEQSALMGKNGAQIARQHFDSMIEGKKMLSYIFDNQ